MFLNKIENNIMSFRISLIAALCLLRVASPNLLVAQSQNIPGRVLGLSNVIPEHLLPEANNDSLRLIDSLHENSSRIAVMHHVEINFKNQAEQFITSSGRRLYRLRLNSPNALGLTLLFNEFYVAADAELFIYGSDTTVLLGPYSNTLGGNGTFTTPPIAGNSIIIELIEPPNPDIPSSLELFGVGHVYAESGLGLGESSLCNNDVNCSEGSPWLDQKRSVVKLIIDISTGPDPGPYGGTGVMVNNSEMDGTLYLLTAFHNLDGDKDCILNDVERSRTNLMTVIFNYESDYCDGPIGNNVHSVSGAQLLTYSWESDFALLRLLQSPSSTANVYLAGWDSRNLTPLSGVGIHHPKGDLKKISIENETLVSDGWNALHPHDPQLPDCQNTLSHHWRVQWNHYSEDHNGITEGRSSGSPFFNHEGRIIGQLHGGNSDPVTCHGPSINNVVYPGFDMYGKLSTSWYSGGIALSSYLDPVGGTAYMDGVYLNTIVPPITNEGSGSPGSQTSPTNCQWGDGDRYCTSFNEHIELIDRHWDDESGLKRAFNTITAEDVTIVNGSSVRYEAMNAITLKAPFTVDASRFTAVLGDCECRCPSTLFMDDFYCSYDNDGPYVPGGRYANPDTILDVASPALYPNPTTGLITYTGTEAVSGYQIMDLQGRTLHSVSLSGSYSPPGKEGPGEVNLAPASTQGPIQIDLSPYRPGTYLLRVQHESGKTGVHRVVRQ
jgi:hypothetical protein